MFDPFSSADFSRSQQPEQKYGIAHALLEHLQEDRAGKDYLSLLEVFALLKGVSDSIEDGNWMNYDRAQRKIIRDAVSGWLEKAVLPPCSVRKGDNEETCSTG
jgi:hypothetical protein